MTPQRDEVRELVKAALDQGMIPDDDGTVEFEGQSIRVTHLAGERIRFDLTQEGRALELIGSRLFERDYDGANGALATDDPLAAVDDDWPDDPPTLATDGQVVNDDPVEPAESVITNDPTEPFTDPATHDPNLATQLDYHGNPETMDTRRFPNPITCACGNVRWVKNADLFQVKQCKPCIHQGRRERRKLKAQAKRAAKGGNGNTSPS